MRERAATAEREAEDAVGRLYSEEYGHMEDFVNRQHSAPLVRKSLGPDDFELCPQGRAGFYLHPQVFEDTCLNEWWVFIHDIRKVSGRHRHQGGIVLFVIDGVGYTTMNGVRYNWKAGDLVLMPLERERVDHQHFNTVPGEPCAWLAFIHIPTFKENGSEITQTSLDPDWVAETGITTWKGASVALETIEQTGSRGE